tara:strand:- start:442 stop:699 length:258 start_codon:yes stop_codon:yes gene_type:complete
MKTISIEILNPKVQRLLQAIEGLGLIRIQKSSTETSNVKSTGNKEMEDFDLDQELAKYGFTMDEIVAEVKEVRAEYGMGRNEDNS